MKNNINIKNMVLPIVVSIFAILVALLMTVPIIKSEPKDIPLAVISLDQGIKTPAGEVNAGSQLVEKLTDSTADSPFTWKQYSSLAETEAAVKDGDVYGSLVVPANYTASVAAAKVDPVKTPLAIDATINMGKNATVASSVQTAFQQMSASSGVIINTTIVNPAPEGVSASAVMALGMLLFLPSWITAFVMTRFIKTDWSKREGRAKIYGIKLGLAVATSFIIGVGVSTIASTVVGIEGMFWSIALFGMLASFAFQTIVLAAIGWLGTKGMIIPVIVMVLGTSSLSLPYEFLPNFWQDFVYPWVPQHFMGLGMREIVFMGKGAFDNSAVLGLLITTGVGLVALTSTLAKPIEKTTKK